jgi:hypothetical protein
MDRNLEYKWVTFRFLEIHIRSWTLAAPDRHVLFTLPWVIAELDVSVKRLVVNPAPSYKNLAMLKCNAAIVACDVWSEICCAGISKRWFTEFLGQCRVQMQHLLIRLYSFEGECTLNIVWNQCRIVATGCDSWTENNIEILFHSIFIFTKGGISATTAMKRAVICGLKLNVFLCLFEGGHMILKLSPPPAFDNTNMVAMWTGTWRQQ